MNRPNRTALSFGIQLSVGTTSPLVGRGRNEIRLPALVGRSRIHASEAVALNPATAT